MKIKKAEAITDFKPISIIITIESEEELKALIALGATDHSVPQAVAKSMGDNKDLPYVTEFCTQLRRAL